MDHCRPRSPTDRRELVFDELNYARMRVDPNARTLEIASIGSDGRPIYPPRT